METGDQRKFGYGGGWIMLDHDQPDSKPEETLRYRMKLRFWYQEYTNKT